MFLGLKWILMQTAMQFIGRDACREHTVITRLAMSGTSSTVVLVDLTGYGFDV